MFSLKEEFPSELSTWFSDKLAFRNVRLGSSRKASQGTVNWIKSIFSRTYELIISFRVTLKKLFLSTIEDEIGDAPKVQAQDNS